MKNIIAILVFALLGGNKIEAQKSNTHFMMVSIHAGSQAHDPEMIIIKDDGIQKVIKADKHSWMWTGRTFDIREGKIEENEDSLFLSLKTFFDSGWKLVSTNIIKSPAGSTDDYIERYFFTKEDN